MFRTKHSRRYALIVDGNSFTDSLRKKRIGIGQYPQRPVPKPNVLTLYNSSQSRQRVVDWRQNDQSGCRRSQNHESIDIFCLGGRYIK